MAKGGTWMYWGAFVAALSANAGCGADAESTGLVQLGVGGSGTWAFNNAVDATISKSQSTTNFGSSSRCIVDGGATERSCAIRWDTSSIPTHATVSGATIQLNFPDGSTEAFPMYYVLRDWVESSVTWNQAASAAPWGSPGANAASDRGGPFAYVPPLASNTTVGIPLSAPALPLIQSWVSTPSSNRGILIAKSGATDRIEIRSSEDALVAYRPILKVTYTTSGGGGTAGAPP